MTRLPTAMVGAAANTPANRFGLKVSASTANATTRAPPMRALSTISTPRWFPAAEPKQTPVQDQWSTGWAPTGGQSPTQ